MALFLLPYSKAGKKPKCLTFYKGQSTFRSIPHNLRSSPGLTKKKVQNLSCCHHLCTTIPSFAKYIEIQSRKDSGDFLRVVGPCRLAFLYGEWVLSSLPEASHWGIKGDLQKNHL